MLGKSGLISLGGRREGARNFHIKNKLESEIISDKKKVYNKQKYFSLS